MNRGKIYLTIVFATLFTSLAGAHHSFAMFDFTKEVKLEGTVKEFAWQNPHALLMIDASTGPSQPMQTWTLEMGSPGNLSRQGLSRKTFTEGDRVRITVFPLRSGQPGGAFFSVHFVATGKDIVTRPVIEQGSKPP